MSTTIMMENAVMSTTIMMENAAMSTTIMMENALMNITTNMMSTALVDAVIRNITITMQTRCSPAGEWRRRTSIRQKNFSRSWRNWAVLRNTA